jgi:hypothetical protein
LNSTLDLLEDLPQGEHLQNAAKQLQCSRATVYRHIHKEGVWKFPPLHDANSNRPDIKRKRKAFCSKYLTPTKRLRKSLRNATTIDNKQVYLWAQNKTQQRQFRRKGSTKPLRKLIKSQGAPKVHGFFAANARGTEVFLHASKRPKQSGKNKGQLMLQHRSVNRFELADAIRQKIGPFMVRTGSDLAYMDCVRVNHTQEVKRAFAEFGIEVLPSSGYTSKVIGGSPPTSHDLSILDGNLFNTFQTTVSQQTLALPADPKQTQTCQLYDQIEILWKSVEYRVKAANAMKKLPHALSAVLREDGGPTGR